MKISTLDSKIVTLENCHKIAKFATPGAFSRALQKYSNSLCFQLELDLKHPVQFN